MSAEHLIDQTLDILIMIWRLRLVRWCFRVRRFFADLGQRIYGL
jgi:hypothetical protein